MIGISDILESMEWINFRHLYSFWMVHRCGGFNAAASEMRISQSTVSEQVVLLEDYLQSSLFERSTRKLRLTEMGHQLFRMADDIFSKSREINRIIRDKEGGDSPRTFRIGIVGGVSRNLLYRLFQNAFKQEEELHLDVINGDMDELVRLCKRFELDFLITTQLPNGKDLIDFKTKLIEKSPMIIAGKKKFINNILKRKSLKTKIPAFLFSYPFIKGDLMERMEKNFDHKFVFRLNTDDISLLRFFANSNDGVAVVPEVGVQEDLNSGSLEKVSLHFIEEVKFYALYSRSAIHFHEIEALLKSR